MSKPRNRRLKELLEEQPQLLGIYAVKASKVECNLAIGQPEMDPPEELHSSICNLINQAGYAGYVSAIGSAAARQAVADYFKSLGIGDGSIKQVAITNGARSMISYVLMTLCCPGNRVLWFGPGYTYADTAKLLQLNPILIPNKPIKFSPDLELLKIELNMAEKFKQLSVLVINNPVNPTGRVWSRQELESVAKIISDYNIFVIADETYAGLVFDDAEFVPFATIEGMAERTITVGSGSKSLRIPGYRLGFVHGPEEFIKALAVVISNMAGCPNVFALLATQELCHNLQHTQKQLPALLRKRQLIINWCCEHSLELTSPQGAFYSFINFKSVLKRKGLNDTKELADILLEKGVGITPGQAFGQCYGNWARISYAGPENILVKGLQIIGEYISN